MRYLVLGFVMVVFWICLSGMFELLFLFFGAVSVGLVLLISYLMDRADHETDSRLRTPSFIGYWTWLARETIKSNLDMVRRIWSPSPRLDPGIARIPASQETHMGKVIYANSITLTPGTVTLDIDDKSGFLEVHAIDRVQLDELREGEMDRHVSQLEKKGRS